MLSGHSEMATATEYRARFRVARADIDNPEFRAWITALALIGALIGPSLIPAGNGRTDQLSCKISSGGAAKSCSPDVGTMRAPKERAEARKVGNPRLEALERPKFPRLYFRTHPSCLTMFLKV